MAQDQAKSKDRILYLVPTFPTVSETFVYREISALQKIGKTIGLCSLYEGEDKNASTPDLDTVQHLYVSGFLNLLLVFLAHSVRHPLMTLHTKLMFLVDFFRAGIVTRHARALAYQFIASARVARQIRRNGYQHIHAHFAHSPTQVAMYASRMSGVGFSFTGHANDIYERGFMLPQKARRVTRMITISDFNKRYLVSTGVPEDKVSVVRAILLFPEHAPKTRDASAPLKIGSLGRLVEKKGFDTLISSLSHLRESELAKLTIEIGGDGPQAEKLEAMAEEQRKRGATINFLGQMSPDAVSSWMQSLDGFALACRQTSDGDVDGIPVVLMEAVATGLPVISTTVSGVTELIQPEKGGMIGQPDSPEDVAQFIRELLEKPEVGHAYALAAQQRLHTEFDADININRLISTAFTTGSPK